MPFGPSMVSVPSVVTIQVIEPPSHFPWAITKSSSGSAVGGSVAEGLVSVLGVVGDEVIDSTVTASVVVMLLIVASVVAADATAVASVADAVVVRSGVDVSVADVSPEVGSVGAEI